ncbi:Hypothetical predicted protein [Pelobates cultripes]|uniref:Uncharacterized protein n=1 Tax=Pelobates cultripes TaxID=61616 RepID=A0AAD1T1U7_PELCU|nr:Hypothetical predicted protein [Pelobates cultripes]
MTVQTWQENFDTKFDKICQEFWSHLKSCTRHPAFYAAQENQIAVVTPPSTSRHKVQLKHCQANHAAAQRGSRNTPHPVSCRTPEQRQRPQLMHNRSSQGPMWIQSYSTLIATHRHLAPVWSSVKGRLPKCKPHDQAVSVR